MVKKLQINCDLYDHLNSSCPQTYFLKLESKMCVTTQQTVQARNHLYTRGSQKSCPTSFGLPLSEHANHEQTSQKLNLDTNIRETTQLTITHKCIEFTQSDSTCKVHQIVNQSLQIKQRINV